MHPSERNTTVTTCRNRTGTPPKADTAINSPNLRCITNSSILNIGGHAGFRGGDVIRIGSVLQALVLSLGVIQPGRSRGNVRLYSDYDIALLKRVKSLVDDMGINLPGVEVILRMIQHMGELQNELQQAQEEIEKLRGGE